MEVSILDDSENKLFDRRELRIKATYEGKTPSRDEIREGVCKKLNLSPDTFDIIRIDQGYGLRESEIVAHSYKSKESMEKFARKGKAVADAAAPGAAKPAEAKAEGKKGEKK